MLLFGKGEAKNFCIGTNFFPTADYSAFSDNWAGFVMAD